MKYLIAMLFLFSTLAPAQSFWVDYKQDKYADEVEKAKIDYRRAIKECNAMPAYEKAACRTRNEAMWRDVQKGLKKQHLGKT